nr:hypothetical protein GCM10020241_03540 [Streptoalloteichus tenebrarius]
MAVHLEDAGAGQAAGAGADDGDAAVVDGCHGHLTGDGVVVEVRTTPRKADPIKKCNGLTFGPAQPSGTVGP